MKQAPTSTNLSAKNRTRAPVWRLSIAALIAPLLLGPLAVGQESQAEKSATDTLLMLVGGWNLSGEFPGDPDSALGFPMVREGKARRTMVLGGTVLQEEVTGAPVKKGKVFHGFGLMGYDTATGKYWRTWVDNHGSGVTVLHGSKTKDTIVFRGESTDADTGKTRDVLSIVHLVTSTAQEVESLVTSGGKETKALRLIYEGGPEECSAGTGGACSTSSDCCQASDFCTTGVCSGF